MYHARHCQVSARSCPHRDLPAVQSNSETQALYVHCFTCGRQAVNIQRHTRGKIRFWQAMQSYKCPEVQVQLTYRLLRGVVCAGWLLGSP